MQRAMYSGCKGVIMVWKNVPLVQELQSWHAVRYSDSPVSSSAESILGTQLEARTSRTVTLSATVVICGAAHWQPVASSLL